MISSPKPAQRQTKSPSQRAFALFTTDPSGFFGFVPVIRLFGRFRRIPHGHDGKRTDIFRQIQLFAQGIHHALHRRGAAIAGSDAVSPGGQHQTLCGNSAVDIDEAPFSSSLLRLKDFSTSPQTMTTQAASLAKEVQR